MRACRCIVGKTLSLPPLRVLRPLLRQLRQEHRLRHRRRRSHFAFPALQQQRRLVPRPHRRVHPRHPEILTANGSRESRKADRTGRWRQQLPGPDAQGDGVPSRANSFAANEDPRQILHAPRGRVDFGLSLREALLRRDSRDRRVCWRSNNCRSFRRSRFRPGEETDRDRTRRQRETQTARYSQYLARLGTQSRQGACGEHGHIGQGKIV